MEAGVSFAMGRTLSAVRSPFSGCLTEKSASAPRTMNAPRAMSVFRFMVRGLGSYRVCELRRERRRRQRTSPNPMKASGTHAMLITLMRATLASDSTVIGPDPDVLGAHRGQRLVLERPADGVEQHLRAPLVEGEEAGELQVFVVGEVGVPDHHQPHRLLRLGAGRLGRGHPGRRRRGEGAAQRALVGVAQPEDGLSPCPPRPRRRARRRRSRSASRRRVTSWPASRACRRRACRRPSGPTSSTELGNGKTTMFTPASTVRSFTSSSTLTPTNSGRFRSIRRPPISTGPGTF